jgi:tetratricopeptide (TPR) repeat protein
VYRTALGPADPHAKALGREAAERLASAGERAYARIDLPAAANLLGRASGHLEWTDPLRVELASDLVFALRSTGELAEAERVLAEARAAAAALGDERLAARLEVVELDLALAGPDADAEDIRHRAGELSAIFSRADDDLGLARAWAVIAFVCWLEARAAETARALECGIEHCRRAGARGDELHLLEMLVLTYSYGPTPLEEGIDRCREVLRRADGALLVEAAVERGLGRFAAMHGRLDEAREHMERGVGILDDLGLSAMAASTRGQGMAFVERLAGDTEAAERVLREHNERLEAMGEQSFQSTTAANLADLLVDKGEFEEAQRYTDISERSAAPRDVAAQAQLRSVRARLLARRGEFEAAESLAREAVEITRESDFLFLKAAILFSLADVLWRRGSADEAEQAADEAFALLEAKGAVALTRSMREAISQLTEEPQGRLEQHR